MQVNESPSHHRQHSPDTLPRSTQLSSCHKAERHLLQRLNLLLVRGQHFAEQAGRVIRPLLSKQGIYQLDCPVLGAGGDTVPGVLARLQGVCQPWVQHMPLDPFVLQTQAGHVSA